MTKYQMGLLCLCLGVSSMMAQQVIHPDSVEQVWEELERRQELALDAASPANENAWLELVQLGVWDSTRVCQGEASVVIPRTATSAIVEYLYRIQEFEALDSVLKLSEYQVRLGKGHTRKYQILLAMQRWELSLAKSWIAGGEQMGIDPVWLAYQKGKIGLREKRYEEIFIDADSLVLAHPEAALAWLLKAEAAFWLLDLETAEEALIKSLTLDPFNADARFWYGYVIWRKRDATLLDDMAAQWELALAVHPLHFLTHWHWGNGHTNLTFADYYEPNEEEIRTTPHDNHFPQSPLYQLTEGSIWYESINNPDTSRWRFGAFLPEGMPDPPVIFPPEPSMDQVYFLRALCHKPHYGPAHNGLAAVLKQKQIRYLTAYDSLEQAIGETVIERPGSFYNVFPDVKRYPGDRVAKMVYSQLHTGVAYLDMLDTLDRTFAIPPLHEDLAIAMDNPWFRGATTFDNRQWMDIRGVGSGATGIEYVERGSHLERNVTLHEYVHLFHGTVLTDREQRRIRQLYEQAMAMDHTLDYYARNNEYEYFAQGFPAYFSTVKVHPLNHKSVNTRDDLLQKDPDLYAFIDTMVQRQQARLDGDSSALAANWAQAYLRLVDQALIRDDVTSALAYLDRAFAWDSSYLPVYLAQANLSAQQSHWKAARNRLDLAAQRFPKAAEVPMTRAELEITLFRNGTQSARETVNNYQKWFQAAQKLEQDPLIRAEWQAAFRRTMRRFVRWDLLVNETESYLATADTTSTYLRDLRDEALADLAWVKGMLGYDKEADSIFTRLVLRKPQNLEFCTKFGEVLLQNGRNQTAKKWLVDIWLIYQASGNSQAWLDYLYLMASDDDTSEQAYLQRERIPTSGREHWFLLQVHNKDSSQIALWASQLPEPMYPEDMAMRSLSRSFQYLQNDELDKFETEIRKSLQVNPFDLKARATLIRFLQEQGRDSEALLMAREGQLLPITPGPQAPEWARFDIREGGEE